MVRLIRGFAAALIGAAVALGLAVPANAQGDVKAPGTPEGNYTVNFDGQASTTWDILPICVPTVGDLRDPLLLPVACRLKVKPAVGGGADAVQVGGLWTFEFDEFTGAGVTCPDGTKAGERQIYSFDGVTLAGNLKVIRGAICGEQPSMRSVPFTLAFNHPLPPVTDYPLLCEPGGLKRCF